MICKPCKKIYAANPSSFDLSPIFVGKHPDSKSEEGI